MKWNNGKERKKFEAEQARLREQYIAADMTEEQIQAMYDYDLSVLNGNRREAIHNQRLDIQAFDEEDTDEGKNPLLNKFTETLTVEIDRSAVNRYAWIDEIEDEGVKEQLKEIAENYTVVFNGKERQLKMDKSGRYFGGVTELYKCFGLLTNDGIFVSKTAKWKIENNKIIIDLCEEIYDEKKL